MLAETRPTLDLVDQVLADAVESVWFSGSMPRHRVASWHYCEERLLARAGGEQDPALDLLRAVLDAARDSVTFSSPMDGEAVDCWRAEAFELRDATDRAAARRPRPGL